MQPIKCATHGLTLACSVREVCLRRRTTVACWHSAGHELACPAQGWWLRVEREVGGLLAPRAGPSALPGDAVGRLDRLEAAVGRLQTVLEAAARQLEASAATSQARVHAGD